MVVWRHVVIEDRNSNQAGPRSNKVWLHPIVSACQTDWRWFCWRVHFFSKLMLPQKESGKKSLAFLVRESDRSVRASNPNVTKNERSDRTIFSQTEIYPAQNWSLENAIGAFLQTPAPVLDKISGPMGARFLSSTRLGSGNIIGWAQSPPAPALDKNRFPIFTDQKTFLGRVRVKFAQKEGHEKTTGQACWGHLLFWAVHPRGQRWQRR